MYWLFFAPLWDSSSFLLNTIRVLLQSEDLKIHSHALDRNGTKRRCHRDYILLSRMYTLYIYIIHRFLVLVRMYTNYFFYRTFLHVLFKIIIFHRFSYLYLHDSRCDARSVRQFPVPSHPLLRFVGSSRSPTGRQCFVIVLLRARWAVQKTKRKTS